MKYKLKLSKRRILKILKALDIQTIKERLPNNCGTAIRLKTEPYLGVVVNAFDTGTITVQGRGKKGDIEPYLIKELLKNVSAVMDE